MNMLFTTIATLLTAFMLMLGMQSPAEARTVTVNPECAEQWMRTAPNGKCIKGSKCPVVGQKLTIDGNCVTNRRNK